MFIGISQCREEGMDNVSRGTTALGKQSIQALRVLLLKNVTKQSAFHIQRRHASPDIAMVALAGATGELLGWMDFWLSMARSALANRFSLLYHKRNIRIEKGWCSAAHHMDTVQRIGGCVENTGECLQVDFFGGG